MAEASMKLVGIVLIVVGVVALALGGFSYTKREKAVDLGPVEITAEHRKTVPLSPIVGIVAVGAGLVLVLTGSKSRV
jgi:uncharacterized membrane protein YidH (DUF202 family)